MAKFDELRIYRELAADKGWHNLTHSRWASLNTWHISPLHHTSIRDSSLDPVSVVTHVTHKVACPGKIRKGILFSLLFSLCPPPPPLLPPPHDSLQTVSEGKWICGATESTFSNSFHQQLSFLSAASHTHWCGPFLRPLSSDLLAPGWLDHPIRPWVICLFPASASAWPLLVLCLSPLPFVLRLSSFLLACQLANARVQLVHSFLHFSYRPSHRPTKQEARSIFPSSPLPNVTCKLLLSCPHRLSWTKWPSLTRGQLFPYHSDLVPNANALTTHAHTIHTQTRAGDSTLQFGDGERREVSSSHPRYFPPYSRPKFAISKINPPNKWITSFSSPSQFAFTSVVLIFHLPHSPGQE